MDWAQANALKFSYHNDDTGASIDPMLELDAANGVFQVIFNPDTGFYVEGDWVEVYRDYQSSDYQGLTLAPDTIEWHDQGSRVWAWTLVAGWDLQLTRDGLSNIYIERATGFVGVGEYQPGYALDVAGDVNISLGSAYRINGVAVGVPAGSNNQVQVNDNGVFGASAQLTFVNGNLGIGPGFTPNARLHISNVGVAGIIVQSSSGGASNSPQIALTSPQRSFIIRSNNTMDGASPGGGIGSLVIVDATASGTPVRFAIDQNGDVNVTGRILIDGVDIMTLFVHQ
jgi:hypothetical protein